MSRPPVRGGKSLAGLGLVSGALFALALPSPGKGAPAIEGPDAVAVVNGFLSALDRDEREADAMLTDDAMYGVGDVGGSLRPGMIGPMMTAFGRACRLTALAPVAAPPEMPRSVAVVAGTYRCVTRETPRGHEMRIDYLVEGGRLAGIYVHSGPARD